jgi:hypothetical protein
MTDEQARNAPSAAYAPTTPDRDERWPALPLAAGATRANWDRAALER